MEITDDIICQVMAPYYKQPLAICEPGIEPVPHYLEGVDYCNNKIIAERINYDPKWIKLQLKPLSSITDKDAIELAKILDDRYKDHKVIRLANHEVKIETKITFLLIYDVFHLMYYHKKTVKIDEDLTLSSGLGEKGISSTDTVFIYQYLQSKGYDLPNYLLSGKTLHEAGLCIYDSQELKK